MTEANLIRTETRSGAIRREIHWTLAVFGACSGVVFTLIFHLQVDRLLAFLAHTAFGGLAGVLLGLGFARLFAGTRWSIARRRWELVGFAGRILGSGWRLVLSSGLLGASYLWGRGFDLSTATPAIIAAAAPAVPTTVWVVTIITMSTARWITGAGEAPEEGSD